jgi:hypothetical protein
MTATTAGQVRSAPPAQVPWRQLAWVTWRQHRAALAWVLAAPAAAAVAMAAFHAPPYGASYTDDRLGVGLEIAVVIVLQLTPVLAGLYVGAPLIAREAEHGTLRLAWTQATGRTRWLLSQTVPVAVVLALAAAGLGLELRWWFGANWSASDPWLPQYFSLNPLPLAGWVTLAFSIGVLAGAAIRRTVPAMAATLVSYAVLQYVTALWWRSAYLSPLRRVVPDARIMPGGGINFGAPGGYYVSYGRTSGRPGPNILGTWLGFPDGRPLSNPQLYRSAAWLRDHHIRVWMSYQPGSRYGIFQYIEFGWLIALAALLVAAAVLVIRRSST